MTNNSIFFSPPFWWAYTPTRTEGSSQATGLGFVWWLVPMKWRAGGVWRAVPTLVMLLLAYATRISAAATLRSAPTVAAAFATPKILLPLLSRGYKARHVLSRKPEVCWGDKTRHVPSRKPAVRCSAENSAWLGPGYNPEGVTSTFPCSPIGAKLPVEKTSKRWNKHTKQIATVGPACQSEEMLEKLFRAGADIFRLNFSHGAHSEKDEVVKMIRRLEVKYRHTIGILADLQGPKLRIGKFHEGYAIVQTGQTFRLDLEVDTDGDETRVSLPHQEILQTLSVGDVVLLDDGKVRLVVTANDPGGLWVDARVEVGGKLSDKKGVNLPTIIVPVSAMTVKDRADLQAALSMGVDWVALSFVQKPSDMVELRGLVGNKAFIMAKIEKPSAIEQLDEIIALSDGIMVARGDLGVELMHEDVPILQRSIIDKCRKSGCPVVVATQMLESMISSPVPTRAEVNDVATALYLGADAIMLSAESAAGQFPEESVAMQCRIINRVEGSENYFSRMQSRACPDGFNAGFHSPLASTPSADHLAYDSITSSAMLLADNLKAKGMIVFTETGVTAIRAARIRPAIPVIAMVQEKWLGRRLSLYWGVYPAYVDIRQSGADNSSLFDQLMARACSIAWDQGFAHSPEDLFVVTAGLPLGVRGAANVIRVLPAAGPESWILPSTKVIQDKSDS